MEAARLESLVVCSFRRLGLGPGSGGLEFRVKRVLVKVRADFWWKGAFLGLESTCLCIDAQLLSRGGFAVHGVTVARDSVPPTLQVA